jgi:hypothetical protein
MESFKSPGSEIYLEARDMQEESEKIQIGLLVSLF